MAFQSLGPLPSPCPLLSLCCRVEISLRTGRGGAGAELEGMEEGQVVRGRVKRVEAFGVFVKLESGATGEGVLGAGCWKLCWVSCACVYVNCRG